MAGWQWRNAESMTPRQFVCGHCGNVVGPNQGYYTVQGHDGAAPVILICSYCSRPTFIFEGKQTPGVAYGNEVANVPNGVASLYKEARDCYSLSAFTSSVLACRKLLMNIAVAQGADEGKKFIEYVEWLSDQGYVPPNGKGWVDHIRKRGNEATHEIDVKSESDAQELISFVEMLLKFIYEFPSKVPQTP